MQLHFLSQFINNSSGDVLHILLEYIFMPADCFHPVHRSVGLDPQFYVFKQGDFISGFMSSLGKWVPLKILGLPLPFNVNHNKCEFNRFSLHQVVIVPSTPIFYSVSEWLHFVTFLQCFFVILIYIKSTIFNICNSKIYTCHICNKRKIRIWLCWMHQNILIGNILIIQSFIHHYGLMVELPPNNGC